MIDLSLAGLIGAVAGTVVAAVIYHLFVGVLERAIRTHDPPEGDDVSLSAVRRIVLAIDVLAFAALGYWIGRMFDG
ncbi:MAG TPA: hypothetical protein VKE51_41840 [Vicinamibacterales bacterium]|nr:hypothetical protein [Vicinamibacterales bacterium]